MMMKQANLHCMTMCHHPPWNPPRHDGNPVVTDESRDEYTTLVLHIYRKISKCLAYKHKYGFRMISVAMTHTRELTGPFLRHDSLTAEKTSSAQRAETTITRPEPS